MRDRRPDTVRTWSHSPQHRKGVAYRDLRTSERFGSRAQRVSLPSGQERRGYPGGRIERQNVRPSQPAPLTPQTRQALPQTPRIRQTAPQAPREQQAPAAVTPTPALRQGTVTPRVQPGQRPVVRDTPFRGIGEGSFERRAGERGGISNRGNEMRQQPGGFSGGQVQQQRQEGGGSRRER